MMRALYIAKTGMDASQFQLDVVSNNLANVNTIGFKRSRGIFEELYYQTLRQPGGQLANGSTLPSGLQIGTGAAAVATARIHAQGIPTQTGQPLDMQIDGDGFFRVQLPNGTTAYTRDGEFQRNSNGDVVTAMGYPMNPNINIPANATQITVSTAGVVQYTLPGATAPQTAGTILLTTFINPQGLESTGGNLYLQTAASGDPQDGDAQTDNRGSIRSGFLEMSNVNVTEELVNMITAQRSFEMNSRAVTTADQMLQKLSNL
ncbi:MULTISPECIES: flagellar basal-body rod protein FlgG [Chromobacteriaceae]|uniref:Flagellar basal-body rod protein FlgG n=3 Tax=Chromobacteriaceae TaxID=1499392 RepID=A0ABV0HCF1_9NEIS|nr:MULTISPECIES: flagellar basal-body rod protein FlgG [Chromobacteriaceae]MBX9299318.1 flagellar basal-body rod protein FlgG [Chromobacterium vaccinii]ERE06414.1 flagellar basal body rod protein FlgG [Pseudogulbenkiania ferrooxidans EGD-HP2]MBX9350010.1 flagellar basal-body rod protein FlgG [Chromobacterium vaccinii]MBX9357444.1 flagellar basal-body rod protein FlgG [Chromobacterium vaccinii]MCD4505211.1 flagellar basal-body rod protein FlgG [Chromobacterium piscinae]